MPINRARIKEYLRQSEGAPPPVFVGHDDILNDILTTAKNRFDQSKVTRIVQGAPGAGKSSLLHEMQKQWTGTDENPRVVVVFSQAVVGDTSGVIQAIMAAGISDADDWLKIIHKRWKRLTSIGVSVAGYGLSAEFDVYRETKLLSVATRQGGPREWKHPVILAVDEAQRFAGDEGTPEARFLQEIHDGTSGLPLVLVLAGLSDTDMKAKGMHLTRGREIHEVRPLTEFQAQDFMRKLAFWSGLDTSRHNSHLESLADICDGWPRHLRFAGVSLGEEALRVDGDMHRMDWPTMERRAWTLRQGYYVDQSSAPMQNADILTARVMSGLRDGMRFRELQQLVENAVVDCPGQRLPKGMDSEDFLNELIHQGALYRNPEGRVHSPIPSFRTFLVQQGCQPDTEPAKRNDGGDDGTDFRV